MAEETVVEVEVGESSSSALPLALLVAFKLGGQTAAEPDLEFNSRLEAPLESIQPCLILEAQDESQAEILKQTLVALLELPQEEAVGGLIATVLGLIRAQGTVHVEVQGNCVVLKLDFELRKKEEHRAYLSALGVQTKPLQESETTITFALDAGAALDQVLLSENLAQELCQYLKLRLQASLSPKLSQGLSQLAVSMSASDAVQQAFTLFSIFRRGQVSLQFHSFEQLPASAQALLPTLFPSTAALQGLRNLISESDRRTIETLAELLSDKAYFAFNGRFFSLSGSLTASGLSKFLVP